MAKLQVTVCDECKSLDRPTRRYVVGRDGERATMDLCDQHSRALDALLEKHGAASAAKKPFANKVTTVEQIEANKKGKASA